MSQPTALQIEPEIAALVGAVIRESTGREVTISLSDRLIESGLLDSLSMVNLVVALQAKFGVEVDIMDVDEQNFASSLAIAEYISVRR